MDLGPALPLLLIGGAFYLLVLRPARNRQKQQQATVAQVTPGTRVMTTAGLFGTVVTVEGDQMDLEIAPGVTVRYVTAAVAKIVPPAEPTAETGTTEESRPSILEGDTPDA